MAARKGDLRETLRARRRALEPAVARSEAMAAAELVRGLVEALAPPALASYQAIRGELALDPLHAWWWRLGHALLLPRVRAPGDLAWHAVRGDGELVLGAFGLREPRPDAAEAPLPAGAVVVVPGVGFGVDGRRLGQGGGFYDRVLARPGLRTIGVGYACQRCDDLPVEAHDRGVDWLILGGRLLRQPASGSGGGA